MATDAGDTERPAPAGVALSLYGTPAFAAARAAYGRSGPSPTDLANGLDNWPAVRRAQALQADPNAFQAQPPPSTSPPPFGLPGQAQLLLASYSPGANPPNSAASLQQPLAARTRPSGPPAVYDRWSTPDGQTATENDSVSSNGVTYHNGALGGVPGVFVDDPLNPGRRGTAFTPTGPGTVNPAHGFNPDPAAGRGGGPYYDKVTRQGDGRIRQLFGSAYDGAIAQMLKYSQSIGY